MTNSNQLLIHVTAPHFVAGLILENDICVHAAPILKWTVGWTRDELRNWFRFKGYSARVLKENHG